MGAACLTLNRERGFPIYLVCESWRHGAPRLTLTRVRTGFGVQQSKWCVVEARHNSSNGDEGLKSKFIGCTLNTMKPSFRPHRRIPY